MTHRRTIELTAVSSFAFFGISFGMYIATVAEWLTVIPLVAAGLLAFSIWLAVAAKNQNVSAPTVSVAAVAGEKAPHAGVQWSTRRIIDFTLRVDQANNSSSPGEERAA